jgi:hypothetical protein
LIRMGAVERGGSCPVFATCGHVTSTLCKHQQQIREKTAGLRGWPVLRYREDGSHPYWGALSIFHMNDSVWRLL